MSRLDIIRDLVDNQEFKVVGLFVKANYGLTIVLNGKKEEVMYVPFNDTKWVEIFYFSAEKLGVPKV